MFILNERIAQDSVLIKSLKLSDLRLIKDGELTWFLLIPRIADITELTQLSRENQSILLDEVNEVVRLASKHVDFDKINYGSLGNVVAQLHFHIVFRSKSDRAWPGPIWGVKCDKVYNVNNSVKWKEVFCG